MSKIKKKVFGMAIAVGFMAFNFVASNSTGSDEYSSSFTLKNLSALHASATEIYCDDSSQSSCTYRYYFNDGSCVVINGLGSLHW